MDPCQSSTPKKVQRGRNSGTYRGVRMRTWGKWVSEIRVPKTGQRIWLGSYDTPEKAARAYDAAQYCIRGECGQFNLPAERRPQLPSGPVDALAKKEIKATTT
ncbi:ERF FAMILY PROTEIN [Salix koriyanagi]|uniref:ERF FAMILY PROTEIN n=1 Tax=Salix koriyanagi TaxID=2511006 RepID=A0A9Q0ZU90_9ROSI|nr:ERF FAMILY PROTEIN [Salix koriyanagi]